MNTQPIEKRATRTDGLLEVHSIFNTIQGEGPFCGTPCVFVRLAGCNLQCPACDTDYTSTRRNLWPHEILVRVRDHRTEGLVVITGGEPFRQELGGLFDMLTSNGYYVQVESNGTLEPTPFVYTQYVNRNREGVYIVCSPKTGKVHPRILDSACALKYVVRKGMIDKDGLPITALDHSVNGRVQRPPAGWDRPIYVQPIDVGNVVDNDIHTAAAVDSCMKHGYTLQLQIHKLIGVE